MRREKDWREKETESKDFNNKNNISNKNLKESQPDSITLASSASDYSEQKGGIVKIAAGPLQSDQEFRTMQEMHNANHALYYFSLMTDSIIQGKTTGNDGEKVNRIREHLMNLREFISEDNLNLQAAVTLLLANLEKLNAVNRKQWIQFTHQNWLLILSLAEAYGHAERCFPDDKQRKICDIVHKKHYVSAWWWKNKGKKFWMRCSKVFRGIKK